MPYRHLLPLFSTLLLGMSALMVQGQPQPPSTSAPKPAQKPAPKPGTGVKRFKPRLDPAAQIDLNSASKLELMKLPGITAAYADKIIAGRPYLSKAHLVTHRILPMEVFVAIKNQVAARTPNP